MAFNEVQKGKFSPKSRVQSRVAISNNGASCLIMVSGDVFAKFGSHERVKVLVGDGKDTGMIRLVPAKEGEGYKLTQKAKDGAGAQVSFAVYPKQIGLPNRRIPITACEFVCAKDMIVFELPMVKGK